MHQHADVAASYNNIGTAYEQKGDYDRALEYYQKDLSISLRLFGEEHTNVAEGYNNIGELWNKKRDYDQATKYHHKALTIGLKVVGNLHPTVAETYRYLAEDYDEKHDLRRALAYCQQSILSLVSGFDDPSITSNPPLEGINSEIHLLQALGLKAKILARLSTKTGKNDLEMANTTYQLVAELIDKMRTGYKTEGSKLFLGESAIEIYEEAIATALKLHEFTKDDAYKETAFFFAEKGKASVLSQSLQESRAKTFAGIPDSILAKEKQLRIDLAFYDTQLQNERQKKENQGKSKIQDFEGRYFSLRTEYDSLIEELEKSYPKYYDLKYQTETTSVRELQEKLDPQTTVVEYFTGERSIYVFTVARGHFEVTTLSKDSSFETDIEQLRLGIEKNGGEGDYELYVTSARRLYRSLIQPVQSHLRTENLILIPDAVITQLPFAALLTEEISDTKSKDYSSLPYLLKKYAISYAYSANLLLELISQNPPDPQRDYLAFAPFLQDGNMAASRAATELVHANSELELSRTANFAALPAAREEVLGIQKLFRESYGFFDRLVDWIFEKKTRVYLDNEADEETLKKETLKDYRYVHFATHGFANRNVPGLSGVVFAQDSTSSEDDVLFLEEVYTLELNADLVTLSACESGAGKLAKGEGLLSLSRGFLYAGAKNLLVSLWKASDRMTCELMLAFYEEMLNGKSKAQALRKAKYRLIQSQFQTIDAQGGIWEFAKPFYWAPFILIGR